MEIISRVDEVSRKIERQLEKVVEEAAAKIAKDYADELPVITGLLKASVVENVVDMKAEVGNLQDYSVNIELGDVNSIGNHRLFEAFEAYKKELPEDTKDRLKRVR